MRRGLAMRVELAERVMTARAGEVEEAEEGAGETAAVVEAAGRRTA